METPVNLLYTEEMLSEAIEMLEDIQQNMGLFQRQQFGKLKRRYHEHKAISETLGAALDQIETEKKRIA